MKTRNILIALSILAAAYSCTKTEQLEPQAPQKDLVTITATLPDGDAVKGGAIKTLLSWSWNAGDKLTVIGETTEIFTIKPGFTAKKAEFEGAAVKGKTFTILYPGESAKETDWNSQVQKGNNNLDHLQYQASLNDVDEYTTFAFSSEWAEEHGGSLKQTGVLKLTLELPNVITKPDSVTVSADDAIFFSGNAEEAKSKAITLHLNDCTVDDGTLVAWLTTAWTDVTVASGTTLYVTVYGNDKAMSRDIIMPKESVLKTGFVNLFTLTGGGWADEAVNAHYAGGKGTKVAPWIIETKEQLGCVAGDLVEGSVRYYKLNADIDMTGVAWTPLNGEAPNTKYIDLDGANHTISNLDTTFISVLVGNVKDLVIDKANVSGVTVDAGILANSIGSGLETSIVNVDIKNSSLTATGSYTGAVIGVSNVAFSISNCDVENTNVSGKLTAGVVGFANEKIIMDKCSYVGGTITSSARYAGGLVASVASVEGSVISDSFVKDATVNSTADRIGGAVGQLQQKTLIQNCYIQDTNIKGKQNVGGMVGVCYGTVKNSYVTGGKLECTNTGNSTAAQLGGVAGYLQHESLINCYANIPINATGANMGGLVGVFQKGTIDKCYAAGDVTGSYRYIGGLVGIANTNEAKTITNSYCTGKVSGNSYSGGFVGGHDAGALTIQNCFASGDVNGSGFAIGGFIGYIKLATVTIEKSIAWNATVTATSIGSGNWSSACFSGVTFPTCTLTDNYRNPAMALTAYWVPAADYQHANVSASTPLIKQDGNASTATGLASGQDGYPQFPYHGKVEAGKTLSALAKDTLGWSADIWDFSADTPKLK